MQRRVFLSAALGLLAAPVAAAAQQGTRKPWIGVLGVVPVDPANDTAFKQGLGQFGYTDAQNIIVEHRHAENRPELLLELAAELVRRHVDVIFVRGPAALVAAKKMTNTIPVVAVDFESDPVATGFVTNLARPGGNVTGVFLDLPELSGKQLQLLKEVVPEISRVAVLGDPTSNALQFRATEVAARALAMQLQRLEVGASKELASVFEAARKGRSRAVLVLSSPFVFTSRARIGALAMEKRLPAVSLFVEFAEAGGLMAYGPSVRESMRRCGAYVGRILQGAKPGELPIERPEKFELVINIKTARALGLTISKSLLLRADKVIE